jgi:putative acetyltransferase
MTVRGAGDRFVIREDDLSGPATRALVALHLQGMQANTPPESVYALDLSGLIQPGITVWTAWDGDAVVAMGALKLLADGTGEVKSMRTHPDHLRRGAGAQILDHIIADARRHGLRRLSLETGSGPSFDPALALYRKRGFVNGERFSDYVASAFNQFLHLDL